MTFDEALAKVQGARTWDILVGTEDPARMFRALAKLLHPDLAPGDRKMEAAEGFKRLNELRDGPTITVTTKTGVAYTTSGAATSDQLADYLLGKTSTREVVLKVARDPRDNDLLRREAANLQAVVATAETQKLYFPELCDSFPYRDAATGAERHINVFTSTYELVPITVLIDAFPGGLNGRHVAWIWRRLLVALGLAHKAGIIHGAVVPDHVLIEPNLHGLVLANWCYSAGPGQRVPAIVQQWRRWYPLEVLNKQVPTVHTDVSMAMRTMAAILERDAPAELFAFINRNVVTPGTSAWRLLDEFDDVLHTIYGPRAFAPFPDLPGGTPIWPQVGRK